uniref:NADH-ubiquinone oxidoreductase chain 6 n=1 Tax=Bradysia sp. XQM-2020 TaxID=2715249 RepID=A0A6G7GC91_9DIPT|nr:NADH dehydrogenase subunit 6 [Bradysia sp. XQM-2020]
MMHFLMSAFMMVFSFIFSQLKHPLAMGFLLLIQTALICFITGLMISSFWFSYILFLVFLGGMLVLFIYVTSLASNEMFNFSIKLMLITMLMIFVIIILSIFLDHMNFALINNLEMDNMQAKINEMENYNSIYKLYNFPTNWITCLIINYLLFTLIVVVKITNLFYGPIRNMN